MKWEHYEEDLLLRWFPPTEGADKPFTESDIRGIAEILERSARDGWSRIPRIYSVLRKIGQLDAIDGFINDDITDVSFPFSKSTLPETLRDHSARLKFLELQHLVYNTEALDLEHNARHGHFSDPADVPLKKIGELGKGGFGYVDHVVSTITNREYARKLISRGKTFRRDKQVLQAFIKELSNLKRLSHRHLVSLVGSYTDKRFVAIIMTPVAECNLETFLGRTDISERSRSFLRPFFGCLTAALCYLHDNHIRHKDIKPSNVLIKHDQVFLTDFGTSLDWSALGNSTTATAPPTTPRYCAPEVMAYAERNSKTDMWSLGCVFLEMWTVLKRRTVADLRTHMGTHGSGTKDYHSNPLSIATWQQELQVTGPSCDNTPSTWITHMLQLPAALRWSVHILADRIEEAGTDPTAQYSFSGLCCLESDDDVSESVSSVNDPGRVKAVSHTSENHSTKATSITQRPTPGKDQSPSESTQSASTEVSIDLAPPGAAIPSIVVSRPFAEDEIASLAREAQSPPVMRNHDQDDYVGDDDDDDDENRGRHVPSVESMMDTTDEDSSRGDERAAQHKRSSSSPSRERQPYDDVNPSSHVLPDHLVCCSICGRPRAPAPGTPYHKLRSHRKICVGDGQGRGGCCPCWICVRSRPHKQSDREFAPTRFNHSVTRKRSTSISNPLYEKRGVSDSEATTSRNVTRPDPAETPYPRTNIHSASEERRSRKHRASSGAPDEGRKKTSKAKPTTTVSAKPAKSRGFYNILGDALFGRTEDYSKRKQRSARKPSSGSDDVPARELSATERMRQQEEDAIRYLHKSRRMGARNGAIVTPPVRAK
jgi:serine/threonine protein kinase